MKPFVVLLMTLSYAAVISACGKNGDDAEQREPDPVLSISQREELQFTAAAQHVTVTVSTNQKHWEAVSNQGWCKIEKRQSAFTISAEANAEVTPRPDAMITVTAGTAQPVTLRVRQVGAAPYLTLNLAKREFDAAGGDFTVDLQSNTDWTITWPGKNSGLVTVFSLSPDSGKGAAQIRITARAATKVLYKDVVQEASFKIGNEVVAVLQLTRSGFSYAIGDYFPVPNEAASAEGIVFWLDKPTEGRAKAGKILSPFEGSGDWGVVGNESINIPEITDVQDGSVATAKMMARYWDVNAFNDNVSQDRYLIWTWIYSVNSHKLDGKWYIPSFQEMQAICTGFSGKNLYTEVNSWTAGTYTAWEIPAAVSARSEFNRRLSDMPNGKPLHNASPAEFYFTSTQNSDNLAKSLFLPNGICGNTSKAASAKVRAIKKF